MIFLLFFFFASLYAEEPITPYLTSENNTLSLLDETVNTQNGKLIQVDHDIAFSGAAPLELIRYYDGGHHFEGEFGYGVGISLPVQIIFVPDTLNPLFYIQDRVGSLFSCKVEKKHKNTKKDKHYIGQIDSKLFELGYTNCCEALLRGEAPIYNMSIEGDEEKFLVTLGDGTRRHYKKYKKNGIELLYRLEIEEKPNGHQRHFDYTLPNYHVVKSIKTTNSDGSLVLSWMNFDYDEAKKVTISASNGQTITYYKSKKEGSAKNRLNGMTYQLSRRVLNQVKAPHLPQTDYEYKHHAHYLDNLFTIDKVTRPDGRILEVDYDKKHRVRELSISGQKLYDFDYESDYTLVKDALGHTKRYDFSKRRLAKLTEAHTIHDYQWSDRGELLKHSLRDSRGSLVKEHTYQYDPAGFIAQVSLEGEIKCSGAYNRSIVEYTYSKDRFHLLLSEVHNKDRRYTYSYLPGTNLRNSKITFQGDKVVEREFTSFDKNGLEIRKIIDDGSHPHDLCDLTGVTFRRITQTEPQLEPQLPGMTLPKIIEEEYKDSYGENHLLKRIERSYTQGDKLKEEKVFDANGVYAYSRLFDYNDQGRLIQETNPLGEETVYDYDANGNKIYEEKLGSGKAVRFSYNAANLLLRESEEHDNGARRLTTYAYDAMGRCTCKTDPLGQTSHFTYDSAGREISHTNPAGLTEYKEYDAQGNVIKHTDFSGFATLTRYNIHGQPLEIHYPDGTRSSFEYNHYKQLVKESHRDGTLSEYEVDEKGRPLVLKLFAANGTLLRTTQNRYKGPNLILEIDALGHETRYTYDGAGRRLSKVEGDQTTTYGYDSLGRLAKTTTSESVEVKVYDFLDRVIEERTEDLFGKVFRKVHYVYDIHGNRTQERVFSDETHFSETIKRYDSQNRLITEISPQGHTTSINYVETDHLEKETLDPLQRRTLEIYGILGRVKEMIHYDASNKVLASRVFKYDPMGHKILHDETLYVQFQPVGSYRVATSYDAMGQKLSETEQDLRATTFTYKKGRLHQITKPDGVILTHTYDPCGRLQDLASSDESIHYQYTYDLNDNVLKVEDLTQGTVTERRYDAHDRLIWEKQATGFEVHYAYDNLDRLITFKCSDKVTSYTYSPTTFASATYQNHTYFQNCNWQKKPLNSTLEKLAITYTWDPQGHLTCLQSPPFTQEYAYDAVGNLCQASVCDPLGSYKASFSYDDLNQLIQEQGPFENSYRYDSLNNRRSKNDLAYLIDTLNQITQADTHYTYDPVGRRKSQNDTTYTYDALGRLLTSSTTRYTYDPFGRRLTEQTQKGTVRYLYQFDTEVGSYQNGFKEFRALLGKQGTFAVELDQKIFFPLCNHRGDLCVLFDKEGHIISTTRYDAFGNASGDLTSPWLFCGQRFSSDLYHFDKREYDPRLGCWLTPDPLGFADGPNLYAYVHNNPLSSIDPYGLWGLPAFNSFSHSFSRGVLDDMTWGASNLALGTYKPNSFSEHLGYYAGTGASLAAGLYYGGTEAKACYYTGKALCAGRNYLSQGLNVASQKSLSLLTTLKNQASRTLPKAKTIFERPATTSIAQQVKVAENRLAKGGTYVLKSKEGEVMRVGRTNNFDRRNMEHIRDPQLRRLDFEPFYRTNSYKEQRGLEQILHDRYNPPLNKINPISSKNPNKQKYMDSALEYLKLTEGEL